MLPPLVLARSTEETPSVQAATATAAVCSNLAALLGAARSANGATVVLEKRAVGEGRGCNTAEAIMVPVDFFQPAFLLKLIAQQLTPQKVS